MRAVDKGKAAAARGVNKVKTKQTEPRTKSSMPRGTCHTTRRGMPASRASVPRRVWACTTESAQ